MTTPPNAPEVGVLAVFDDCIAKIEYHYRDTRAGAEMAQARIVVAALLTREAALVAEAAGLREDIADRKRVIECKNIDIRERDASLHGWAERAKKAEADRDALAAEVGALRLDAERLNWLDANNIQKRMGWKVGVAPAGNVLVSSVVFLGSEPMTIRSAIDIARTPAKGGES